MEIEITTVNQRFLSDREHEGPAFRAGFRFGWIQALMILCPKQVHLSRLLKNVRGLKSGLFGRHSPEAGLDFS